MSVSFGKKVLPTKIELIRIKKSLKVSRGVYKILEDKREVLLRRLDEMISKAGNAREELWDPISEAYSSLYDAYLKMGPLTVETIASTVPQSLTVSIDVKKIVDVDVPTITIDEKKVGLTYSFSDTCSKIDVAAMTLRQILAKVCKAAEFENAIFRLANELEKTQRLINALEFIIIPQYEEGIKSIASTLEEREREEFVRLKHVKKVLQRKRTVDEV